MESGDAQSTDTLMTSTDREPLSCYTQRRGRAMRSERLERPHRGIGGNGGVGGRLIACSFNLCGFPPESMSRCSAGGDIAGCLLGVLNAKGLTYSIINNTIEMW